MIFGFETVSVDSPDYGKKFFQKWNSNGNKLSKAWLDASWDPRSRLRKPPRPREPTTTSTACSASPTSSRAG